MKHVFLFLFMAVAITASAQNLATINTVKPKLGQKMAFETAYKTHVAKFHKADEKISTWEILSGKWAGHYHLVNGGQSMADFDKERADANAHSVELDKNFFPMLQETINGTYSFRDTLSFRPNWTAEKCQVNVRHIHPQKMNAYLAEQRRNVIIGGSLKSKWWENFSMNFYVQLWSGSDPVVVSVRNLADGFASLENGFYGTTMANDFKNAYISKYGTLDWENRDKLMSEAVVSNDVYIMKLRKDMSSQ